MTVPVIAPQPGPQTWLVQCPVPDVFFGGQRGGGKSFALLLDALNRAETYGRNWRGILTRETYPEMEELLQAAMQLYAGRAEFRVGAKPKAVFANGAELWFRYLADVADAGRYQGQAFTWFGADEVGNLTSLAPLDMMWGSLRSAHGIPCVRRLTGNPGGKAHALLKRRYIDPDPKGMKPFTYEHNGQDTEAVFIPSRLEDNPRLMLADPDYERKLALVGGPTLYRAWRYGDWDISLGALFPVIPPTVRRADRLASVVERWVVADWGFANEAPALWIEAQQGLDGLSRHHVYQEWCPSELPPARWAAEVIERTPKGANGEREPVMGVILDAAAFDRQQNAGPSPAEQMLPVLRAAGWRLLPSVKGPDSVRFGIQTLRMLWDTHGDTVAPLLTISPDCPKLWQAVTEITRGDPEKGEDPEVPAKGQHPLIDRLDALRYYAQSRVRGAPPTLEERLQADAWLQARVRDEQTVDTYLRGGMGAVPVGAAKAKTWGKRR